MSRRSVSKLSVALRLLSFPVMLLVVGAFKVELALGLGLGAMLLLFCLFALMASFVLAFLAVVDIVSGDVK
jgi:pilus assembly protein TadC